jgi:hypothetical protein
MKAGKMFNKFWVSVTVVITVILLVILFPLLLDKYGVIKAILLACLIPFAMVLAYIRGYWVSTLFAKKNSAEK